MIIFISVLADAAPAAKPTQLDLSAVGSKSAPVTPAVTPQSEDRAAGSSSGGGFFSKLLGRNKEKSKEPGRLFNIRFRFIVFSVIVFKSVFLVGRRKLLH